MTRESGATATRRAGMRMRSPLCSPRSAEWTTDDQRGGSPPRRSPPAGRRADPARIVRAREEAARQLAKTRDVLAWQAVMARLDVEEGLAREPVDSPRLTPHDSRLPALAAVAVGQGWPCW